MLPFANAFMEAVAAIGINTADPGDVVLSGGSTDQTWTVPAGVYNISVLCQASGGNSRPEVGNISSAGSGGDLRWANNIPVTPGEVLTWSAYSNTTTSGAPGRPAALNRADGTSILCARGGRGGNGGYYVAVSTPPGLRADGSFVGGGNGGLGSEALTTSVTAGGGGAGGYSGNGGSGCQNASAGTGPAGTGGAAGGGLGGATAGWSGGGVGLYGEGASGAIGSSTTTGAGSQSANSVLCGNSAGTTVAGKYGAGAGSYNGTTQFQIGGAGAIRILWGKGANNGGRSFPATKVANKEGHSGNATALWGTGAEGATGPANIAALYDGAGSTAALTAGTNYANVHWPESEVARYVASVVVAATATANLTGASFEKKVNGVWSIVTASVTYSTAGALLNLAVADTVQGLRLKKASGSLILSEFAPVYV